MGVEGDRWGERSLNFAHLDADFLKRKGEFPTADNGFVKDWHKVQMKKLKM